MAEEKEMNYSDTLNLPKTDFPMRGNLPQNEPTILNEVFEKGLYEKMLKKNEGKEPFVLHDGPPYANGEIHLGHALNKRYDCKIQKLTRVLYALYSRL